MRHQEEEEEEEEEERRLSSSNRDISKMEEIPYHHSLSGSW